jgi:hypothetical protein
MLEVGAEWGSSMDYDLREATHKAVLGTMHWNAICHA